VLVPSIDGHDPLLGDELSPGAADNRLWRKPGVRYRLTQQWTGWGCPSIDSPLAQDEMHRSICSG